MLSIISVVITLLIIFLVIVIVITLLYTRNKLCFKGESGTEEPKTINMVKIHINFHFKLFVEGITLIYPIQG